MTMKLDEPFLLEEELARNNGEASSVSPAGAVVPAAKSLWVVLPRMPGSRADFAAMVAARVPLPLDQLVWTDAVADPDGTIGTTVVPRSALDALERSANCIDERTGLAFCHPNRRFDRQIVMTIAIIGVSLAVSVWAIAGKPEAAKSVLPTEALTLTAALGDAVRQTEILPAIQFAVLLSSEGFAISQVAAKGDGRVGIDFETADPDQLRAQISASPRLEAFRQVTQVRSDAGTFRASFEGKPPFPARQMRAVTPLVAESPAMAAARMKKHLAQLASRHAVQLTESAARPDGFRPVDLALSVEGPEPAVLAFARAVEGGEPPVAITEWSFAPSDAGARFSASLTVPWVAAP